MPAKHSSIPRRCAICLVGPARSSEKMASLRLRRLSPATTSNASGRNAGRNSNAPTKPSSTVTNTREWPSSAHCVCTSSSFGGRVSHPSPTKIRLPMPTLLPPSLTWMPKPSSQWIFTVSGSFNRHCFASSTIALAMGWLCNCPAAAAWASTCQFLRFPQVWTLITSGCPSVKLPVMSNTTVSTVCINSKARMSLTKMPCSAQR